MKTKFYTKILITVIAMLLVALNVFPQAPPTTTIPSLTCQEGTVIVPVTVNNFNGVGNISLRLNYDPAQLIYQNVVVNPAIPPGNTFTTAALDASGQFRLSFSGANGVPGITLPNGSVLFTLTFTVKSGVSGVLAPLTWSTLQGNCDYSPPSTNVFNPIITTGNLSTYFINGSVAIKPIPIISGPNSVCPGSSGNIYSTQAGMSNYTWNVSAGGTITAGTSSNSITVTWPSVVSPHSVNVNYTDPVLGCTATTSTVYSVNVFPIVNPTLSGPNSVCFGTSGMVYTSDPGQSNYHWLITGGTITSGGTPTSNTATVTWNTSGAQSISVDYTTTSGCSTSPIAYSVFVTPTVGTPTDITFPTGTEPASQLTNATTTTSYATTATNSTGFNWSISNPLAGSINTSTGVMTWSNGFAGSVNIQVTANGCNAPSTEVVRSVTITPAVGTPTAIAITAGSEPTCQLTSSATTTYTTTATNSTGFNWSLSNPLAGSINTSTGVMTWSNGFTGSVDIRVTANGGNVQSSQVIRSVTVTPTVGTPSAITISAGSEPTCQLTSSTTTTYATSASDNTGFVWSISNSAAGSINASTGVMTWSNGFAGSVDIHVIADGCNGPSSQVTHSVTVTPTVGTPSAITISAGSEPTCQLTSSTTTTYATSASNNTGFVWSISNAAAGSINASTGVMTWSNGFAGSVDIHVIADGCNGPSSQVTHSVTVTPTVGTPSAITVSAGSEPTCQLTSATTTTYATSASNNTGFVWSLSNSAAGSINASTGVMTWSNGFAGSVDIHVIADGCNGPSSQVIRSVTVTPSVTKPVFTMGKSSARCTEAGTIIYTATAANSTGIIYSLDASSLTAGNTINGASGALTYKAGWVGATIITATATGCNGPLTATHTITNNPLPIPIISGSPSTCINSTGNVYTTESGMADYIWSVSAGGKITAGGSDDTNTVTVTWNTAGPQTVSVNYTNGNGCSAASNIVYPVTVKPLAIASLNGSNSICAGTTGVVYTTESGMSQYHWIISAGGTKTSGGTLTDNTLTVTWNTVGSQSVSVDYTPTGGCTSIPTVLPVTINSLPTPTITGTSTICANTTGNVYTTQIGMTNYTWNVSSGGTITAGGTSTGNTVTVTWKTAGSQTVSVNYANASGCQSLNPVTFNVMVNTTPTAAGNITGSQSVNAGAIGVTYSVGLIPNATAYVWSIPIGATIASGNGTNSITVNFAANALAGNISVYGNNACADGVASPPFAVSINTFPAVPGSITGLNTICQGTTGITYTVSPIYYATGYVWTTPTGATITSGANTNSITVNYGLTAVSGNVTVYGTNLSGNGAVSSPLIVTVNSLPATPVITDDGKITMQSSATTGNQWYNQNGTISGATNQTYTATQNGSFYVMINGVCASAKSNTIIITKVSVNAVDKQKIEVYPNPNIGSFWIEYKASENEKLKLIQVLDLLGKPVFQLLPTTPSSDFKEWVNIKDHPIGVYILVLTTESRKISRRIVITK